MMNLSTGKALLAAALLLAPAGAAKAALWEITTPGAPSFTSVPAKNDTLGGTGIAFGDGALSLGRVEVLGNGRTVDFFYLGSESGWTIKLTSGAGSFTETNSGPINIATALAGAPKISTTADAGLLDMVFAKVGGGELVRNASNPNGNAKILFGYLDPTTYDVVARATNLILFALDDGGAGPDSDYDDYVGVMRVTPLPAAAWMLLAGLGGLAGARRLARRQA
jgi:hypothetical protein